MPNRILREGILTSDRVERLNWAEEVFYRRVMSVVDDFGRYYARPALLRAACYPLLLSKVSDADIQKWLDACVLVHLLSVYQIGDKAYLQMHDFRQQMRAKESKFPQLPVMRIANATQTLSEGVAPAHLGVSVFGVVCEGEDGAHAPFVLPDWIPEDTWAAYCKVRVGKKAKNEPHALGLIVKDLEKFRAAGHNPVDVLNNSIKSGWAGVFEPKSKPSVVGVTVPGSNLPDPALTKIVADGLKAVPPSADIRQKLQALKGST